MKRLISHFLISVLFLSCAQSGFNGNTAVEKKQAADATPKKPTPKPTVTPVPLGTESPVIPSETPQPSRCTDAGTTVAKLVTTGGITNNAANQFLEYELSMEDCDGVVTPITANAILFDLDAEIEDGPKPLPYQIKGLDGSPLGSGILQTINGSDLFGVIGLTRFHHRTNNNINVPAAHRKIRLIIDLSLTNNQPMGSAMSGPVTRASISTFLRFGTATPVKTMVPFITNVSLFITK